MHLRFFFFFLSFLAASASENSRALSRFHDLPWCSPGCTYTVSESSSPPCREKEGPGQRVFLWGSGSGDGSADMRGSGEMCSKPTGVLEQRNTTDGRDPRGRADYKIYISFIVLSPIERTFCWGDVCQGLLIQFVPPVLFLNQSEDLIPGML